MLGRSISPRLGGTGTVQRPRPQPASGVESGKLQAVETMLDRGLAPQMQGPDQAQRDLLEATLSRVDRGLLLWAQDRGVRLQVLQSGEELEATEALRDLTGKFEHRLKPETVEKLDEYLAPLTEKIRGEKDADRALLLRRQKRKQLAELLTLNPCGATVFTPAFAPLLAPGVSSLPADPGETPTLKAMALYHGADSPQEQASFYAWMEKLNGERMRQARQATIEERSRLLESRPEALKAWLRQVQEHPELVPLDVTLYTLLVPDAHFLSSLSHEQPLLVDSSDLLSVEGWRNGDFRGQWFFLEGKTNLLIRDSAVGLDTPIHELGHVIDMTLEKEEPELYGSLRPRIEKAYYQARLQSKAITSYAKANPREYIAEGFAAYYDEPARLRKVDPELYGLIEEMVEFCCRKAGADRTLELKLQKMWQDAVSTAAQNLDPAALRNQFEQQVRTTPSAQALSQTAMAAALSASRLGLLAGAAEVALGHFEASPPAEQTLADPIQKAYREGVDAQTQRRLFELGYQNGRSLQQK
jgi:hypothetical protein